MKKIIAAVIILCLIGTGVFFFIERKEQPTEPETTVTVLRETVTVTFPEGFSTVQIAQRLEESGVCPAEDFMKEVNNIDIYAESFSILSGIDSKDKAYALEGYIFPDTYEFYKGENASSAIKRFLRNTDSKFSEEHRQRAKELGFTVDEVIILASIVQKEAGFKQEMPKVASVLINRLKSPSYPKLQCDVTINYVNDYIYDSPFLSEDTSKYGALYNTYKCDNLPAGAICNPGIDAIEAVLYAEDTNYFFFVTDSDNNYYYSATYEEHLKKCKEAGL